MFREWVLVPLPLQLSMITLTIMIDHIITMVGIITTVGIIVVDTTTIITADIEEETTIMVDTDTITDVVIAQK